MTASRDWAKFEALLQQNQPDPDIRFRFEALLMQREPARVMDELRKTLDLQPTHIPALLGLAMICLKEGDSACPAALVDLAFTRNQWSGNA